MNGAFLDSSIEVLNKLKLIKLENNDLRVRGLYSDHPPNIDLLSCRVWLKMCRSCFSGASGTYIIISWWF